MVILNNEEQCMKWFSAVLLTALALMASPVWAGCDLSQSGVPIAVRGQLETQCLQAEAKLKEQAQVTDAQKLSAYADVATQLAKAVGIAANELGVAVNEFIKTPAGILTIAVILIKVFGKLMALIFVAIIVWTAVARLLKHLWYKETGETMEISGFLGFGKKTVPVRKRVTYSEATEGQVFITALLVLAAIGSLIPIPMSS
jgi:hypothetical protein